MLEGWGTAKVIAYERHSIKKALGNPPLVWSDVMYSQYMYAQYLHLNG